MFIILSISGDLRDDHNPEFAEEFYRALSVVCDDLFFARYKQQSQPARALTETAPGNLQEAAKALLTAMFDNAYNEDEKGRVVDDLIDTRLLPATDGKGTTFTPEKIKQRYDK